ncbi:MAG: hypothetical protein ACRD2A_13745 [Vicinamibacterales bacterium]
MSGINTGKVITGGLLAGLVLNILDFLNNYLIVGEDFRANATRLGLDPAAAESAAGIATWVVIDFLFGILVVFTYAAIRPRFGAGVKTAIYAGLIPWLGITLIIFGLTQGGLFPMALWMKMAVISAVITSVGAVAGAWAYKEA